ncbi:MAG: hypothetical protein M9900_08575 [Flavobacteriales bacterium]|nr:hypothetical protein [Flavobacteriales bacterium]
MFKFVGLILASFIACWIFSIISIAIGSGDPQYELDELRKERLFEVAGKKAKESAEPYLEISDSIYQMHLAFRKDAWRISISDHERLEDSIYHSKHVVDRFVQHAIYGFGSAWYAYGNILESRAMQTQGKELMAAYVISQPGRTKIQDALYVPAGFMLTADAFGKHLLPILLCVIAMACTSKLHPDIIRILLALAISFALESFLNSGYVRAFQYFIIDTPRSTGIAWASPITLLIIYLPISIISISIWPKIEHNQSTFSSDEKPKSK